MNFEGMRENYLKGELSDKIEKSPIELFKLWMSEAIEDKILEPTAMTLSTINSEGFPASRTVLLKEIIDDKFIFYTNYQSNKGRELEANPNASLLFLWKESQRQVIISGSVAKTTEEKSNDYFSKRPKASQLGAWTSPQSSIIESRKVLDKKLEEVEERFGNANQIPRPPHWGGFALLPSKIEFWQGRANRLHDRIQFHKRESNWITIRVAP